MNRILLVTSCLSAVALAQPKPREKLVAEPGMWVLDADGRTEKHVCANNEEIEIGGQRNVVTLTGPCKSLRIVGEKNTVNIEVTTSVSVMGSNNTVNWQRSPAGKPRQYLTGSGNTVTQVVDPKQQKK
jgi:hypothetical protein